MDQQLENPLEHRAGYAVKRLQLAVRIAVDDAIATTCLSMAQFAALSVLVHTGPIVGAELARLCFITRQSMQDVINSLRKRDLIENVSSTDAGRKSKLAATAAGEHALKEAMVRVEGVDERMMRGMPSADRARFLATLHTCAENLKHPGSDDDGATDGIAGGGGQ